MSTLRSFVVHRLVVVVHSSKVKTILFPWSDSLLFQDVYGSPLAHQLNINNYIWIDALTKPFSNDTDPNSIGVCDTKLLEK